MQRQVFIILILLILAASFSSCSFMPSPDNTIASPRPRKNISSNNDNVNSIITGFMPSSSVLLVTNAHSDRKPIHIVDLDGDRINEIILTFKDEKEIVQSGFMVLKKGKEVWEKQFEEKDEYGTINLIDFRDITGDKIPEIFIGKDGVLYIYHYADKQYKLIKSIPFTEYTSSDISNSDGIDSMIELLVYNKIINEPSVNVLRWNGCILQEVTEEYPDIKQKFINYYKEIIRNSHKSEYWFNLSKLQMDASKKNDSLTSVEKAISFENHPDTILKYQIFKAHVLINLGRHDEAIQLVSSNAVQRESNIANCKSVIAESYFLRKDYNKAREIYRQIAVFPYDENIQKIDTAIAEEKLYEFINSLGEEHISEIPEKLNEFGKGRNLTINSIIPYSYIKDLSKVLIVDYHLYPSIAHGKDSVGAHLIYWWNNGKLYCMKYTTIGLYSNHHLIADLNSIAASIKVDVDGRIKMRITFQNSKKNKNNYPDTLNQTFLFKNNSWKFFWK